MQLLKRALVCAGLLMSAFVLNINVRDARAASPNRIRPMDTCSGTCNGGYDCVVFGSNQCGCASYYNPGSAC